MSDAKPRPPSSSSSLLQDVPGAFPADSGSANESNYQSLSQAIHARRAEYTRPKEIKIKVGTWNSAGFKGTVEDVGGWFVQGQGVAESLAGLNVDSQSEPRSEPTSPQADLEEREDVETQEARYDKKKSTLPDNDPGSVASGDEIGLYLLGLQEIVDINSATEALRPYTDASISQKWKQSIQDALPKGYQLIAEQQLIGLLLLIYASPDVASDTRSVSTTSVGTGLMGYMGNKGAVTARIVLGETTRLVFINAHLAAGTDKGTLDRRNWDYSQIMSRTRFDPIQDSMGLTQASGEAIGEEDVAFFVGDLNYRLEGIPGEDVRRLLMLHTRNEYDLSQKAGRKIDSEIAKDAAIAERRRSKRSSNASSMSYSSNASSFSASTSTVGRSSIDEDYDDIVQPEDDPASLQTTLSSLLPHDELQQQIAARKAFQDWKEGPITFLPTYKYDVGSVGVFDTSEKRRAPSWCDRILYRTRRDRLAYESLMAEIQASKQKDDEMKRNGLDEVAKDEDLLYDYDPNEDAAEDSGSHDEYTDSPPGVLITKEGFEDELHLEYYGAHQRVLSSDHKPLDAVFTLKYDAVVPSLRAQVHQEVARELDRKENEGRPSVTVVVDKHHPGEQETSDSDPAKFEGVSFGEVRYAMHKQRNLTVANTGRVPAAVSFIERPVGPGQAPGIAPSWLTLKFEDGTKISSDHEKINLEPGDTINVVLELRILDVSLARAFNEGIKGLEDILVLRVDNGRDHFIPLRGTWLESSIGHSINKLIRIPEGGIRKLQRQRPDSSKSGEAAPSDQPVMWSAPRELFRLTEAVEDLTVRSVAEWFMISADEGDKAPWEQVPDWPFAAEPWTSSTQEDRFDRLALISDALDCDEPFDKALDPTITQMQKLESMASCLLLFLRGMPDGLINEDLWSQVEEGLIANEKERKQPSGEEQRTWIQEVLSQAPSHSISFILLCAMLDRITNEVVAAHTAIVAQRQPSVSHSRIPSVVGPGSLIRRKTGSLGKDPSIVRRQMVVRAMAVMFAPAVIRTAKTPASQKERAAVEDHKVRVMELFLTKEDA